MSRTTGYNALPRYVPSPRSPAIGAMKASIALCIKSKNKADYGVCVYSQALAEERLGDDYWRAITNGESDSWPECPQEGKR